LFFVGFFEDADGAGAVQVGTDREEHVEEAHGRRIRVAEVGFDWGEEAFVGVAGYGGNKRISDSDAVGAVGVGLLKSFDRLAKAAAEADGDDEVVASAIAGGIGALAGSGRRDRREPEQGEPIVEEVDETDGQVSAEDDDAASAVNAFGQRCQFGEIKAIAERVEIADILLESLASMAFDAGVRIGFGAHALERGCTGDGEFMEIDLEMAVTFKPETANNAQDGGGVGV